MRAPKRLDSLTSMGWLCHLLLLTGAVACSEVDLKPVSSGQGGAAGSSGAGGRSGAAGNHVTPDDPDASVGAGSGGTYNAAGAAGSGGGGSGGSGGGGGSDTPPEPTPYAVDGGFATVECSSVPSTLDAGADAGDAGSSTFELADRDCDGLADSCSVDGECASENLVVQYLFEQNLRDATPYGNDATDVSDVSYEPGVAGAALVLGPSSAASIPRAESLEFGDLMTVELWVLPRALPSNGGRAGLLDDDGRYGLFLTPLGELRCVSAGATLTAGTLSVNEWAHVACVLDASMLTLWQDGVVLAQAPRAGNLPPPAPTPVVIGGNSPSGDRFEGLLDNLRIWREARSPAQLSRAAQTRQ